MARAALEPSRAQPARRRAAGSLSHPVHSPLHAHPSTAGARCPRIPSPPSVTISSSILIEKATRTACCASHATPLPRRRRSRPSAPDGWTGGRATTTRERRDDAEIARRDRTPRLRAKAAVAGRRAPRAQVRIMRGRGGVRLVRADRRVHAGRRPRTVRRRAGLPDSRHMLASV